MILNYIKTLINATKYDVLNNYVQIGVVTWNHIVVCKKKMKTDFCI